MINTLKYIIDQLFIYKLVKVHLISTNLLICLLINFLLFVHKLIQIKIYT